VSASSFRLSALFEPMSAQANERPHDVNASFDRPSTIQYIRGLHGG
jgi:hypothetical protein